jgi:hypothetical protein
MSTWNLFQEHTRWVLTGRTDTPHPAARPCENPEYLGCRWLSGVAYLVIVGWSGTLTSYWVAWWRSSTART